MGKGWMAAAWLVVQACGGVGVDVPAAQDRAGAAQQDAGGEPGPDGSLDGSPDDAGYQGQGKDAGGPQDASGAASASDGGRGGAGGPQGDDAGQDGAAASYPDATGPVCVPISYQTACPEHSCNEYSSDGCQGWIDCTKAPTCASQGYVCGELPPACSASQDLGPPSECGMCPIYGVACDAGQCVPGLTNPTG